MKSQIIIIDSVKTKNNICYLSKFMMSNKNRFNIPLNILEYKFKRFCKAHGLTPEYNK